MLKVTEIESMIPPYFKQSDLIYVCVIDIEGQIWFANDKFQKLIGSKCLSTCEVNFSECIKENQEFDLHSFLIDVTGKPNQGATVELNHNGQPAKWEFTALVNSEGDFSGILGVGYPKQVVVSTSQTDYTFPKEVNPATDIYFELNHNWQIKNANELAEKFFELKKENLIGNTIWQIYPEKDIYRYALEFKKAKESKTMRVFEDFNSLNGRWYKMYILPRKSGLDVIFKDISQIQNLSDEIQQLQFTLQSVLENAEENIFLVGKDLRLVGYNSAAEKLVKQYFNKNLQDGDKFINYLFEGLDDVFLKEVESILSGKFKSFELAISKKGKKDKVLFSHKFFPLIDNHDNIVGFGYASKDINDETAFLNKIKGQNKVMRDILHNQNTVLRSPLSSILGLLELVDDTQLDKENKKYISYLKPLAQDLDKIIRQNSKKVSDLD
ncbi:PAS domain-containing protein [Mongoliibacter ruber]|uniref:histidine kinase n=1 Tax=Mongoliibacter ruber TaxID=1750599 RepID=A0A2T0WVI0_9BACT|nr:PAS domain-containing protein [Mongoliibacter ruber]PRY90679.1 PAS domain S-box-containing protein [Mongoliibacter ruber]